MPANKWLPVVSDYCTGCGRCVEACPNSCLELDWDFAKLVRAGDCLSEGDCVAACQYEAIFMQWVAAGGTREVGKWCEVSHQQGPPRPLAWLGGMFSKRSAAEEPTSE